MKVSVITPSFRNSRWLKLCIASVADQQGVELEHIVQDAGSDDGTQDWLPHDPRVKAFIEQDGGMYDAINRGWQRAGGEILAHLNCDEQYLPGALEAVAGHFRRHPATDILIADTVIVDADGKFLCCRKCIEPIQVAIWLYNPTITSSLFIRRRVIEQHGLLFDTKWRDLGDIFWMIEAVKRRLNFAVLRRYTSAFSDTGENMNLKPNARRECELKVEMTPAWIRRCSGPLIQLNRTRNFLRGLYHQKPFSYALYTHASPSRRVDIAVENPTCRWSSRHGQ
jgi:glycosyltransferase involved in cell wall biosynthesis